MTFADLCQRNAAPTKGHACFTIEGQPRPWSEQNDGPAIQTVAILAAFAQLDAATQQVATELIGRNLEFLLSCYQDQTTNLWEEHVGFSFFVRSVQLRCFREVAANTFGIPVPEGIADAIAWLENALAVHWTGSYYATMIGGTAPGNPQQPTVPEGYDPNIDIVQASIYGVVPCTDTKLLATAAQLITHWADPSSPEVYPVNLTDASLRARARCSAATPATCTTAARTASVTIRGRCARRTSRSSTTSWPTRSPLRGRSR